MSSVITAFAPVLLSIIGLWGRIVLFGKDEKRKVRITLLLILMLNTYAIFTNVARADETGLQDTKSAETLDSAEVPGATACEPGVESLRTQREYAVSMSGLGQTGEQSRLGTHLSASDPTSTTCQFRCNESLVFGT